MRSHVVLLPNENNETCLTIPLGTLMINLVIERNDSLKKLQNTIVMLLKSVLDYIAIHSSYSSMRQRW